MTNETMTWTSDSGKTVEVSFSNYLDRAEAIVVVDGKRVASGAPFAIPAAGSLKPAAEKMYTAYRAAGCTHTIQGVGLKADKAAMILAALAELQDEIDATPEKRLRALIAKRQDLVEKRSSCLMEASDVVSDAHAAEGDMSKAYELSRKYEADAAAITAKLATFDAAHPDVIAAIEAAEQQDIARFLATD